MPQSIKPLFFTKEEIDNLTDQFSDLEIANQFGIAYSAVRKARVAYGIKTFTQKTGLVKIKETGELRKKGSVRGVVRSDGLKVNYFKTIDTQEKSYWLGLLISDGWSCLRNGVPKEIGLAFQVQDSHLLYDFQKEINHSGNIVVKENKRSLAEGGISTIATLRVTCQEFTRITIEAGVSLNKSGNTFIPSSIKDFSNSFCRGILDGDGSIGERSFAFITVSDSFQEELRDLIARETGIFLYPSSQDSPVTGKPITKITGYRKDKDVLKWIYTQNNPCLKRKYQKFLSFWN